MSSSALNTAAVASLAAAALGGGIVYAALSPGSQLFGKVLIAGCNPNEIALTYDDGPNLRATSQLLDVLAAHNTRATFFLIGQYVRREPALTREIAAAGHLIGNHTMTHPWLAWQTAARIRAELRDCNQAIQDTLGAPVYYFRPPHGARRPFVLRAARELGLTAVQWNVMPKDWKPLDAPTILARMERGIRSNSRRGRASNILLHDGSNQSQGANRLATVEATRQLLALSDFSAHRFVTPDVWAMQPNRLEF